jgi:2-phospho-L-lactate guanylyltransferase
MSGWTAVVPVKRTDVAKTRLSPWAGDRRAALALAFARDTVAALHACADVGDVVVVTDDAAAAHTLRAGGTVVVADEPRRGLNPALVHGAGAARARREGVGVVCVSADLPALRPDEVGRVLAEASRHPRSFVADASGVGTTVVAFAPGVTVDPRFGARSRARHRSLGVVELGPASIPSVRRDVDTLVDLWDAVRLGVGPATRAVLAQRDP